MKPWKITLILLAIVLLSGLGGGLVGNRLAREQARRRSNPEAWNVSAMRTLEKRLRLTPEQVEKVQALLDARVVELRATREETMTKTNRILDQLIAEIDKVLTPEQVAEFTKLHTQRKRGLEVLNVEPRK
jgi:Spy/CpxP family protein refolding chaperone